jgi:PQQ-dependent dehydrogenase (methanol/ethanol family)
MAAASVLVIALGSLGCTPAAEDDPAGGAEVANPAAGVDGARIAAADAEPGNWLSYGRDYGEQRFSPLDQIDTSNVDGLGLTWSYETGSKRGHEATPLVVDGVMYVTSTWSKVHALNAATGEELWSYDPKVSKEKWARRLCCDAVNRGAAMWNGKVYVGVIDGRLVALDAATGEEVWSVQTTDVERHYTITGAPRIAKGNVIIGNGGAEYGVRGYVTAYDAETGEQAWRFYTVPGNPADGFENEWMEAAAKTWSGEWWKVGGGGTAWDSMSYDPELELLYVGVGNGAPWTRFHRSPEGGDNLYLCSIIALRPDTGELVWHYQTTPGDNWDYTSVQHIMLVDLEIDGAQRQALVHAPKNGFFYVLDRATGELISAENYVPVTWASHIDPETGRPVEIASGQYDDEAAYVRPSAIGGHNWHPMSYSPLTGLVYVPTIEEQMIYSVDRDFEYEPKWKNMSMDSALAAKMATENPGVAGTGNLLAWDPVAQEEVWRVEHPGQYNSGVVSTAGNLLFQGTVDGLFAAYAADTGERLWETTVNVGMMAPPITYTVDGEQYVALVAGFGAALWGGDAGVASSTFYDNVGRVLAFKLGGDQPMPQVAEKPQEIPEPPPMTASAEEVVHGRDLFAEYCSDCHGFLAISNRVVPDLKFSIGEAHDLYDDIVLEGSMASVGMPAFDDLIGPEEVAAIRSYVVARAHEEREIQQSIEVEP